MDKEVKKILILGIIAIVVLLVFIVIILGPRNSSEDSFVVFPDSTATTESNDTPLEFIEDTPADTFNETIATTTEQVEEPFTNIQTDNWQDTIIIPDRTYEIEYSPSFTSTNTGLNQNTGEPFSKDDLISQGIFIDDFGSSSIPPDVSTTENFEPDNLDYNVDDWSYLPTHEPKPEPLEVTRFKHCGSVSLGVSEDAIERYFSRLANKSETTCLGKAVAKSCQSSKVTISALFGAVSGTVYVAERNDGVCGFGIAIDETTEDTVTLCDIGETLNANLPSEEHKSFDDWKDVFEQEPGKTFAKLFSSDEGTPPSTTVSCISYKL